MLKVSLADLEETGVKGDWCFLNEFTWIAIRFGENVFDGMTIIPCAPNKEGKRYWSWDGNVEFPTLTPSILVHYKNAEGQDVTVWHGFLTAGKLIDV